MAVKIARQPDKIVIVGAPTSAAALSAGHEGAPSALRSAGLIERLKSAGYDVVDSGDGAEQLYRPDEESPRARNISGVIASLESLKPRVEQAVKLGALPLILGGDCSIALATVAGVRRYFRNVGLIYVDRDAGLHTPSTTTSGCLDGMVVSHLTGRGAAELVRFWGEPPLVREPELILFGVDRLDPAEEQMLSSSSMRCYLASEALGIGPKVAAQKAIELFSGRGSEFVLHFDVDVISDFRATDYPGTGGLSLQDVRKAIEVFAQQKRLAAIEVTGYNPTKDSEGSGASLIVDLLAGALGSRLAAFQAEAVASDAEAPTLPKTSNEATVAADDVVSRESSAQDAMRPAAVTSPPGEAWSSDVLKEQQEPQENTVEPPRKHQEGAADGTDEPSD